MNKKNNIILKDITVNGNMLFYDFCISDGLSPYFLTNRLFIEYDRDMTNVPISILSIPFVGCLIGMAWLTNSTFWVKEIDETFYEAIPRIRQAYQEIYEQFPLKGRFAPAILRKNVVDTSNNSNKALLLFSGGADAHASFIRNIDKKPLLCNIQGMYNSVDDSDFAADADKKDIAYFASQYGFPTCFVRSNFAKIINVEYFNKTIKKKLGDTWWHGMLHSMAFLSISIPVAFKEGLEELIIASSLTIGLNHYCASNLTTDCEFRFAKTGYTTHDGFELNRQDKIHIIVNYQKSLSRPYPIRVCSFNDHNCCECEKCLRTVLGIVAEVGNPKDFGFLINKPLKDHWEEALFNKGGLMSFASEEKIHYPHIRKRMKENYNYMNQEQKDFVDWFLNLNFKKIKKEGLRRYYYHNFFSILKRKILLFH